MKPIFRGKILDRRYRIISTLAKGGFGETYVAEDTRLPGNPRCVVKHLKPGNSNTALLESAKRLFSSEAETLQKLGRHDQIPQLLAYFEENREFYLVQELIEGHPLTHELIPRRSWLEPKIHSLLQQILEVLAFVHGQGVIHRDIKPDNILRRTHDGKLVLVDFGTVKQVVAQNQVSTTIIAGTPGYMPTEQGRGKPRPSSDLYALGIIGIQAATGLHPSELQEDPNTGEILWRPWAQCSDALTAILSKMVRYHFKERYQSAEEVLRDLEPLLGSIASAPEAVADAAIAEAFADAPDATVLSLISSTSPDAPEDSSHSTAAPRSLNASAPPATPTVISGDAATPLAASLSPSETVIAQPPSAPAPADAVLLPAPSPTLVSPAPPPAQPPIAPAAAETIVSNVSNLPTQSESASGIAPASAETIVSMPPRSPAKPAQPASPPAAPASAETIVSTPPRSPAEPVPPASPPIDPGASATVVSPLSRQSEPASKSANDVANDVASNAEGTVISQFVAAPQLDSPAQDEQPVAGRSRRFRWLLGAGTAVVAIGVLTGAISVWQQRQAYLQEQQTLEAVEAQQAQGNYSDCIQQAQQVSQRYADLYSSAQTASGNCQLALAQQLAEQSRFKQAIETASQIPSNHPAHQQAQALLTEWAKGILKRATDRYQAGKLNEAVTMAGAIPNTSSIYSQAQTEIQKWNEEWNANNTRWNTIEKALKEGRWQTILNEAKQLTTPYWQQKAKQSVDRANSEIAAAARAAERARAARESAPTRSYSGSGDSGASGYGSSGSSGGGAPAPPPSSGGSDWVQEAL